MRACLFRLGRNASALGDGLSRVSRVRAMFCEKIPGLFVSPL
jgi:hypothetical protein